ncbi:ABC transporter substrate-binding protein [Desulfovibrio sp. JC010]|uniref:substrate-binding periplasmic protein n=1 Tax=Desulfovibrio sp. JC010 TaxID=2593641 RepID=UPI0013D4EA7D|nr:transporter substrate-binding domain-containing protein [Desulfovibrio sp. JC010]NDV28219.1 amino acid ABC transporter substrate-binding protein [Desulfovibrio sp. JC010]
MKKYFHKSIASTIIALSFLCLFYVPSYAEQITVGYIELPPYYFTTADNKPEGFLLHLTKQIMEKAGHKCTYKSMPSKRILHTIKKGGNFASIGWFKTRERKEYAKFSLPIYENEPFGLLLRTEDHKKFYKFRTLKDVLAQDQFKTGYVAGHSMGEYVDRLLRQHPQSVHSLSGTTQQLIKMLHNGKIDFCLLAPEEISTIIKQSGYKEDYFYFMSLADIINGNKRHLIFSRDVSDATIQEINAAIVEIKNERWIAN